MKAVLLVCLGWTAVCCQAQVFKCRDADGGTSYSQQPCPAGSRSLAMDGSAPLSVIDGGDSQRAARQQYRQSLRDWSGRRDKARQAEELAAQRERLAGRKKWLAERQHCQRLAGKQASLRQGLRQGQTASELERLKFRLAKVEDQMQDRACHLYKDD
ncbi:DUF4124 domain-containing protein [Chromobacterium subtsugae]|uniref:DUF4124 domain-containing protein n=1 Tax=Chromobacterium subtsugae TaxID=251747 RepID=A0ABS7FCJ6_9NEIS|nr:MULTISPECIES: DUF4124 domain-containing protein [Chromobacterium]MBW7566328.1 DUF4124 domain-containing protein [Chromobacterium subtsugae]MBW8287813.1 DUF4124 domain-containing protein [Chromobacterium subtsugae]WSE91142.1 DUF4124 domain-containing protein [Chromobacterium subtsugae]WVH59517.1 DUF4124 domain-containing protein [Chromobacterium subtsugae]